MTCHYRIFDLALPSELPLPGMPEVPDQEIAGRAARRDPAPTTTASVRICEGWPEDFDSAAFDLRIVYRTPEARSFASLGSAGGDYVLRFDDCADFLLRADGAIYQRLHPEGDATLAAHFLINQAVPRALFRAGEALLHASAVRFPGGSTVAFLGQSGWGKSTLAAALHRAGATLLSDDCLLFRPQPGAVQLAGLFPGVRLAPATVEAMLGERVLDPEKSAWLKRFGPTSAYSGKQQGAFAGRSSGQAATLDALMLLNDPFSPSHQLSFSPLTGAAALMAVMQNQIVLDPSLESTSVRLLRQGGALLERVPVCETLAYSRTFADLPAVVDALIRRFAAPATVEG